MANVISQSLPSPGQPFVNPAPNGLYVIDPVWYQFLYTFASTVLSGAATGDLNGTYPNLFLNTTGVVAGTYGSATTVPRITIDAKGRITNESTVTITGVVPGGSAGGDLGGTYPNPSVSKINGVSLGSTTATAGNLLIGSGTNWVTNAISGDATLSSTGVATLASTAVTPSTYGDGTHVGTFTVDAKGRLTSASNTLITGAAPSGAAGGDLAGTYPNPSLATTAVTAASYGDGTHVAAFTVDTKGRLTAASNVLITGAAPTGAAGGDLTGTYPNPTLAATAVAAGSYTVNSGAHFTVDAKGRLTSASNVAITTTGTSNRISVTNGATITPTIDISASYVGQSSITTVGTITSGTWTGTTVAVANGGTGITSFGTGIATWLGTPSSANLASAITDETGSGLLVFATSPTLTTPLLGTPTSGTLTNCTGYTDANLSTSDITTNNTSTTKHGFAPKLSNVATQYLDGTGAFSVPTGSGGEVILISRATASASATIDFTSISAGSYDHYIIKGDNLLPATAGNLLFRVSVAGTFQTTNYVDESHRWTASASGQSGSTTDTGFPINSVSEAWGITANSMELNFILVIGNCAQTTAKKHCTWQWTHVSSGSTQISGVGGGHTPNSTAVDGFRFLSDAGNINSGTISVYGVKNT